MEIYVYIQGIVVLGLLVGVIILKKGMDLDNAKQNKEGFEKKKAAIKKIIKVWFVVLAGAIVTSVIILVNTIKEL